MCRKARNEARYSSFTALLTDRSALILDQWLLSDHSFSTNIQDAKSEINFDKEINSFFNRGKLIQ